MLDFPPLDLLQLLVDLYFDRQNLYLPVLHRPTFERHLSAGLHNVDISFGLLVLQVCANGARYSDDPRVLLPSAGTQSAGWTWFSQVRGRSIMHNGTSRLYDLQSVCVRWYFLLPDLRSLRPSAWHDLPHGLRGNAGIVGVVWLWHTPRSRRRRTQEEGVRYDPDSRGRAIQTCLLVGLAL